MPRWKALFQLPCLQSLSLLQQWLQSKLFAAAGFYHTASSFSQGSFSPPHSAPSPGWFLLLLGEVLQTFLLRAPPIYLRLQCLGFSFNIKLLLNQLSALFFQFVLLHPYKGFLEQERASRSVHFSHLQCAANSNATLEVEEALLKL